MCKILRNIFPIKIPTVLPTKWKAKTLPLSVSLAYSLSLSLPLFLDPHILICLNWRMFCSRNHVRTSWITSSSTSPRLGVPFPYKLSNQTSAATFTCLPGQAFPGMGLRTARPWVPTSAISLRKLLKTSIQATEMSSHWNLMVSLEVEFGVFWKVLLSTITFKRKQKKMTDYWLNFHNLFYFSIWNICRIFIEMNILKSHMKSYQWSFM